MYRQRKSRKQFHRASFATGLAAVARVRRSRVVNRAVLLSPPPALGKIKRTRSTLHNAPQTAAAVIRRRRPVKYPWPVPFKGKAWRKRKTGPDPLVGPSPVPRREKTRRRICSGLLNPPPHQGRRRVVKGARTGLPPPLGKGRSVALAANVGTTFNLAATVGTVWSLTTTARTTFNLVTGVSVQANIPFFQGEDLTLNFTVVPLTDITGWTITSTVKDKLGGTTQLNPAVSITDAGRGKFQATWTRAQTSALSPGDYVWDVRRTDSGFNTVLAHGEATCRQPVTP
jgi:hypothetical protein